MTLPAVEKGGQQGPQRIGILGGGQLARMMALAGIPLGCRFSFLDPAPDACAGQLGSLTEADFSDVEAVRQLAREIDIATFDFENVPAKSARALAELRPFHPGVNALEACQDRLAEKQLLDRLGIPVPAYFPVNSRTDLLEAIDRIGFPAVLKTRRFGYDGKGQAVLRQPEDLERAWQQLNGSELILEGFVPFEAECSIVSVRSREGEIRFWPLTRNLHHEGILRLSQPGVFGDSLQSEAEGISTRLLEHWEYVGVMAVELFVLDGKLLVNEIAPRVHNSGHWTIDASVTSQFENHVRAICGLPLGNTASKGHAVMFNWIGEMPRKDSALAIPGLHWHEYGKSARPGRKIGHATLVTEQADVVYERSEQLANALQGEWPKLWAAMSVKIS